MNLYIDYSEFELTCWNTDGKGTNVAIPLTEEQAKKICDIIGIVPIGTAVGTMQRLPTAEDTTMLPGNSTITMYQMTSGKPGKRPGKNFSLVFLFCL